MPILYLWFIQTGSTSTTTLSGTTGTGSAWSAAQGVSGAKLKGLAKRVGQQRAPQPCSNAGAHSKVMHQQLFSSCTVALQVIPQDRRKKPQAGGFPSGLFALHDKPFRQDLSCILDQETRKGIRQSLTPFKVNGTSRAKPGLPCHVLMMGCSRCGPDGGYWEKWAVINRRYCLPAAAS